MSEPMEGFLLLFTISIVSAVLWHSYMKKYLYAVAGATLMSVVLFQVLVFMQLGYLDPFFLIAAAVSGGVALLIAFVVGVPFLHKRKQFNGGPRTTT